jgi:hypothetical protein
MDKPKRKRTKQPSIRDTIANRNPLRRVAVTPIDPYAVPEPATSASPPSEGNQSSDATAAGTGDMSGQGAASPSIPAADTKTADIEHDRGDRQGNAKHEDDPVVMYGTYIRSSQRTGIKLRAALTGRDSYKIIQDAIDEYFENHPLDRVS